MTNLIPPKGQKALKYEYILRILSVYGFMLGGVCIAAAILLMPTYVLINTQLASVEKKAPIKQELAAEFLIAEKEIADVNAVILELKSSTSSDTHISDLIDEIVALAPAHVTFKVFEVDAPLGHPASVRIQGIAASRSELSALKIQLENSPFFETAAVPISDLAREADLPFAITITLEKPTS